MNADFSLWNLATVCSPVFNVRVSLREAHCWLRRARPLTVITPVPSPTDCALFEFRSLRPDPQELQTHSRKDPLTMVAHDHREKAGQMRQAAREGERDAER